jgi:hypothetical protein
MRIACGEGILGRDLATPASIICTFGHGSQSVADQNPPSGIE